MIKINNLSKSFGNKTVLSNISFELPYGSITALTGPNGAGKTTLLKIMSRLILQDSGTINIPDKKDTGFVFNPETSFYGQLTIKENLSFFCALYQTNIGRLNELSELLGLNEFLDTKFVFCSSGIRQRMAIARALLHNPKTLLIDELTKSLDTASGKKIQNLIKTINKENGTTVLFVTHNPGEIETLATNCIHLKEGKILNRQ